MQPLLVMLMNLYCTCSTKYFGTSFFYVTVTKYSLTLIFIVYPFITQINFMYYSLHNVKTSINWLIMPKIQRQN